MTNTKNVLQIYGSDANDQDRVAELLWLQKMKSFENDLDLVLIESIWNGDSTDYLTAKIDKYTADRRRGFYLLKIIKRVLTTNSFHRAIRNHCRNM